MIKRRRRLSAQGIVLLAVLVFVLLAIFLPAANILIAQQETPAPIEFIVDETHTVDVYLDGKISTMPLEQYLVGVVSAEMPASFEPEALKAQAVAARTYTLYKQNHGGCDQHNDADICTDSTHCQAYLTPQEQNELWGADAPSYLNKIQTAVASTIGQVLMYEGQEIQVFYHACSGGVTEDCENVYSQALPYLVSVQSSGEQDYSNYYGKVTISVAEFETVIKRFSPSIKIDTSQNNAGIGQITRYDSGRVESIEIGNEVFTGREMRQIFSLNSTNFTVEITDDITFSTVGFGHGVGMSQTGANAMALEGATYEQILTHYYTGVTIQTLE